MNRSVESGSLGSPGLSGHAALESSCFLTIKMRHKTPTCRVIINMNSSKTVAIKFIVTNGRINELGCVYALSP